MPIYTNATAAPREELASVIVQGQKMNRLNIWPLVAPLRPVSKRQGRLAKLNIADGALLRIMDKIVMPGADIERYTLTIGDISFVIYIRKEEVKIPDETEMDWADYFSVEALATQIGANRAELTLEFLVAQALFNTTNFGAATNSAVAYTAANIANNTVNLVGDLLAALERGYAKGEIFNTVVIPRQVFNRVSLSTSLLEFVLGFNERRAAMTVELLQTALSKYGIDRVLIGAAIYNTAKEGATPVLTPMYSNDYIWVGDRGADTTIDAGSPAGGSQVGVMDEIDGALATLHWDSYDGVTDGGPYAIESYRHEPQESNIVRAKSSATPWVADANRGTLIATQYA